MKNILHLELEKLFGKKDYVIDFEKKLSVLIGENGCGKSTMLNIIYYIAKLDFISLSSYSFSHLKISINEDLFELKHEELEQLPLSTNPDFREVLFKFDFSSVNSFDEFYIKILNLRLPDYPFSTNKYNSIDEYLIDDLHYYDEEYKKFMSKYKVPFGSILYLKCIYNFRKGETMFSSLEKIVSNVKLYSFVDIYNTDKLLVNLNNEYEMLCMKILSKYFTDKEISFKDNSVLMKDKFTGDIIEESQLSSGERKIIKIIELLVVSGSNDFLLLDEPELSLSIYWQRYLIEDLLDNCKAKKIIIATQSPNLLNEDELDYLLPIYSDVIAYDE